MSNSYQRLVDYVEAATDLAEAAREDLLVGDSYSDDTVGALSRFVAASFNMKDLLDQIEDKNLKLN